MFTVVRILNLKILSQLRMLCSMSVNDKLGMWKEMVMAYGRADHRAALEESICGPWSPE
jgi:hypothetical protein